MLLSCRVLLKRDPLSHAEHLACLQGYLTDEKMHPPRTLP